VKVGFNKGEAMMKLAGYEFDGLYTNPSDVKELPGVYIVLSVKVLDVGESGGRYREGGQGVSTRLRRHSRKLRWKEFCDTGEIVFAVLYEPESGKRREIEKTVRRYYVPPCGS
jgi:hypothetical protein